MAPQSAAAAQAQSSAAPADPAPTLAQLEESIIRRLMTQLQQMGITQQQPQQQSSTTVAKAQPQQRRRTETTTTPAVVTEPQPEEEDPWSNWQTTQTANQTGNQGQTSDNTWNTSDNKWKWDWQTTNGKTLINGVCKHGGKVMTQTETDHTYPT